VVISKELASRSSRCSPVFWTVGRHVVPRGIDTGIYVCAGSPGVPFALRWRVLDNLRRTELVLPEKNNESPCRSLDTAREAHAPLALFISLRSRRQPQESRIEIQIRAREAGDSASMLWLSRFAGSIAFLILILSKRGWPGVGNREGNLGDCGQRRTSTVCKSRLSQTWLSTRRDSIWLS